VPSVGVTEPLHLPLLLARWLDERLHETVGFRIHGCRLYGLELIDAAGLEHGEPLAARATFLAEADDREGVLALPAARGALAFDAVALAVVEWRASAGAAAARPGGFAPRCRVRSVELILIPGGDGANALRFEREPDVVVLAPVA
jgi:hypothetical protein